MFAVLHLADFALQAVLRNEPAVAHRPAALFASATKKSVVLSVNTSARAAGVEPGMTAPQAVARCPRLLIRTVQSTAEAEARAALLAVGFTLSPSVEDTAPGVCTADLKGFDPAKLPAAAATAVVELTRLGLPATCGIAATPLLALYAAKVGRVIPNAPVAPSPSKNPKSQRRVKDSPPYLPADAHTVQPKTHPCPPSHAQRSALNSQLPSASLRFPFRLSTLNSQLSAPAVLSITDATPCLAPRPLSVAEPSPELASVLAQWGVRTLGDLTALPRDDIVRRFGAAGLALWNRAAGGSSRPLKPVALPRTFSAGMEFQDALETLEPLLFILRRFLDRLTLELRAAQLSTAEAHLTLALEDETEHARAFRLPEPTADPEILFRTLHTHLESLQTHASISALSLRLTPTRPLVRQQGLFETGLRDPHGFAETLARAMAIVGPDRVGTPEPIDTHRPDAFTLTAPALVISPAAAPALHPPLGLPLRRFRPPLPARIEFTADRATYLWTEHVRGEISARLGPWPSSGNWWQTDHSWHRTEWDISLADGGLYRLFHVDGAYFLEGEYD